MKHWYAKPNTILAEQIRTVLVIEGFSTAGSGNLPVFTNGMPVLFCKTEKNHDSYEDIIQLSLYSSSPTDIWTVNQRTTIIAYFFTAFTIAPLFNIAANQLSEKPFDLNTWNPHKYTALKTQLIYATATDLKIEVLDNLLTQQLSENQQQYAIVQYATDKIMQYSNKEIIAEILHSSGINERTFQRIFKKYVGVTATQYRRICQFQQSFGQLREKQFDKISEVAYDNGFADQSHFNRSFKEFTEITPNDYLKKGLKNKKT